MTQIVRKMISSRPGNGAPASVVSGIDERDGQRDRAAHARPADDEPLAPRDRLAAAEALVQLEHREVVEEPHAP